MDVALGVRRAMRRGGLRPGPARRRGPGRGRPLFFACLAAATVLAAVAPERLAAVLALGFLALGLGMAVVARRA